MHQLMFHRTADSVAGAEQMYNCTTADIALDFDLSPLNKEFPIPVLGKRQSLQRGLL